MFTITSYRLPADSGEHSCLQYVPDIGLSKGVRRVGTKVDLMKSLSTAGRCNCRQKRLQCIFNRTRLDMAVIRRRRLLLLLLHVIQSISTPRWRALQPVVCIWHTSDERQNAAVPHQFRHAARAACHARNTGTSLFTVGGHSI